MGAQGAGEKPKRPLPRPRVSFPPGRASLAAWEPHHQGRSLLQSVEPASARRACLHDAGKQRVRHARPRGRRDRCPEVPRAPGHARLGRSAPPACSRVASQGCRRRSSPPCAGPGVAPGPGSSMPQRALGVGAGGQREGASKAKPHTSTSAQPGLAPDCLQPSLLRRCGFRQQVKPSVRAQRST